MNHIKQHHPAFCEGFDIHEQEFKDKEELLRIEWVKAFSEHDNFHQYSLSYPDDWSPLYHLMAEYSKGAEWYVIGYVQENIDNIPKWIPNERKK